MQNTLLKRNDGKSTKKEVKYFVGSISSLDTKKPIGTDENCLEFLKI